MNTNRIREERLKRKWSLEHLGELVGVHFTTIAKLEKSTRAVSLEMLERIATVMNLPVHDLLPRDDRFTQVRAVPVIGMISTGAWKEAIENASEWIPAPHEGGPHVFGLRPDGDSMNLIISDNSVVLVDPDDLELRDGKIYAIRNDQGEATLKEYRANPPRLEPRSTNPEHQTIPIGAEPFTVIGRIISQFQQM